MNEFTTVVEDLIQLFKELTQIEQIKIEAVKKNMVSYVEDCMNKEQAAVLKLRGLEKKREACQLDMGFEGYTFKQILDTTTGEEHSRLQQLFDTLSYHVSLFQDTNESARAMLEISLHNINKAIIRTHQNNSKDKKNWEGLI
nr:flagellar export chaperone FlgN [uncultured Clostridium sp.]